MAVYTWLYRKSDNVFLGGGTSEPPPHDPALIGVVTFHDGVRLPDRRTERYDAGSPTKRRPATAPEIAAYEAAQLDDDAQQASLPRPIKAMLLYEFRVRVGRNPTAAERTAARDAFIQAYKDVT